MDAGIAAIMAGGLTVETRGTITAIRDTSVESLGSHGIKGYSN